MNNATNNIKLISTIFTKSKTNIPIKNNKTKIILYLISKT